MGESFGVSSVVRCGGDGCGACSVGGSQCFPWSELVVDMVVGIMQPDGKVEKDEEEDCELDSIEEERKEEKKREHNGAGIYTVVEHLKMYNEWSNNVV